MSAAVFLLSSGRSGSTLVQRVLNSYDDVLIWGEHQGFLAPLAEAYFHLVEHPSSTRFLPAFAATERPSWARILEWKGAGNWQAWLNWFTRADAETLFRDFVRALARHPEQAGLPPIWGFKEIRYGGHDRVIEMLAALFPDARFLFLARDGRNAVVSQLRTFHASGARAQAIRDLFRLPVFIRRSREWRDQNNGLLRWHRSGRLDSTWIRFEDLAADPRALEPFLSSIGKTLGPAQLEVFTLEAGRGSSYAAASELNARWKTVGLAPRLAMRLVLGRTNAELGYDGSG